MRVATQSFSIQQANRFLEGLGGRKWKLGLCWVKNRTSCTFLSITKKKASTTNISGPHKRITSKHFGKIPTLHCQIFIIAGKNWHWHIQVFQPFEKRSDNLPVQVWKAALGWPGNTYSWGRGWRQAQEWARECTPSSHRRPRLQMQVNQIRKAEKNKGP